MIRCSTCDKGQMLDGTIENYDISDVMDLETVVLERAHALVCDRCGAVMLTGDVIEAAWDALTRILVLHADELRPDEVRFLRGMLGMSQAALAERLGVTRVTVTRWETEDGAIGGTTSLALRTLVAWSLKDPKLAKAVGDPERRLAREPVARPYRVGAVA